MAHFKKYLEMYFRKGRATRLQIVLNLCFVFCGL